MYRECWGVSWVQLEGKPERWYSMEMSPLRFSNLLSEIFLPISSSTASLAETPAML